MKQAQEKNIDDNPILELEKKVSLITSLKIVLRYLSENKIISFILALFLVVVITSVIFTILGIALLISPLLFPYLIVDSILGHRYKMKQLSYLKHRKNV